MKRILIILAFVLVALFILAPTVLAQDGNPDLPDTAVGALNWITTGLAAAAALLASAFTNWVKSRPWISEENKEPISGAGAQFIAVVSSSVIGALATFLHPIAAQLDERGIYAAILAVVTVLLSEGWFELKGFRKALLAKVDPKLLAAAVAAVGKK